MNVLDDILWFSLVFTLIVGGSISVFILLFLFSSSFRKEVIKDFKGQYHEKI